MTIHYVMQLIDQYGTMVLFVLALLEALNCPGMPAGIILPAGGLIAAGSNNRLMEVYLSMLLGSVLGCIVLYYVGVLGGKAAEHWLKKHSGKHREKLEHYIEKIHDGSWWTMFVCRMIPIVRTLGSLLAGVSRMPIKHYLLGTVAGVAVYDAVGIGLGFFAGWLFT